MRRALRPLAPVVAALLLLSGCGSEEETASDEPAATESQEAEATPSTEPSPAAEATRKAAAPAIEITFSGDTVTPDGVRKKVQAGEPVRFRIVSDRPGELRVHSSPEQEIAYGEGTTRASITIARPGLVDIEAHDPDTLVVQLEVR